MALNFKYYAPLVLIIVIAFKDILCVDNPAPNPWNRNQPPANPLETPLNNAKSTTTPWPELGQRGRHRDNPKTVQEANPNRGLPDPQSNKRDFVAGPRPTGVSLPNLGPNNNNNNQPASPNPVWARPEAPKRDYVANRNQATNNFLTAERGTSSTKPQVVPQPTTPSSKRDFVSNPKPLSYAQAALPNGPNANKVLVPTNSQPDKVVPGGQTPKYPVSSSGDTSSDTATKPAQQVGVGDKVQEDNELREWSEMLVKKDTNSLLNHVTINYQGMTRSGSLRDEAPQPLLIISDEVYKSPSVSKLISLHNNYILESHMNEVYTAQEKIEENNFLDTILPTPVMQHARNFLIQKGKISKDPKEFRDILKTIWFNMYSRGGGKIGSSGFEHVFLAEIKNNAVSGLHNWLYFKDEEQKNLANYLGYMKKIEFEKGAIVKYHFNFHNIDKPVGSMFVGTSPEFEFALYSTCFLLRADDVCPLRVGGKNFIIRTYTYRYRGKNMIGSAFPDI